MLAFGGMPQHHACACCGRGRHRTRARECASRPVRQSLAMQSGVSVVRRQPVHLCALSAQAPHPGAQRRSFPRMVTGAQTLTGGKHRVTARGWWADHVRPRQITEDAVQGWQLMARTPYTIEVQEHSRCPCRAVGWQGNYAEGLEPDRLAQMPGRTGWHGDG